MSARSFHRGERAQSLVEMALALPVLLLLVVGVADFGRAYFYATSVTSAAREAALYAARDPNATMDMVRTRACLELGWQTCPTNPADPIDPALVTVECIRAGEPSCAQRAGDVRVTVTYKLALISGDLARRFFGGNPVLIRGVAVMPGLSQ